MVAKIRTIIDTRPQIDDEVLFGHPLYNHASHAYQWGTSTIPLPLATSTTEEEFRQLYKGIEMKSFKIVNATLTIEE